MQNDHEGQRPTSLTTATPQKAFELAVTRPRGGVKHAHPDTDILRALRHGCAKSSEGLTGASQVVATKLQTVVAANDFWRG